MSRTTWGVTLIILAFAILAFVAYKNSASRRVPIVFSARNELQSLWMNYKTKYIDTSNRVVDPSQNNITTSEGESYALLRAVWQDDKTSFDSSLAWTNQNLQRSDDHLFSWKYGQKTDGSYGILTDEGGENTATDADTDTALALIFASSRWNDASYLSEAKQIISGIWTDEIVTVKGVPYVTADNQEKNASTSILINPSYLAPYAYRIFAQVDPAHPWMKVVDSSYDVISMSMSQNLGTSTSANIPPDWILMNKKTGALSAPTASGQTTDMGYDALRTPFRLTLDWQWFGDTRAKDLLTKMSFLSDEWKTKNMLDTTYSHSGAVVDSSESAAFYGGTLGYFIVTDPAAAKDIYNNKLQILFTPDTNDWNVSLGYYDSNWAWFGIALYNGYLPNLASSLTATTTSQ